MPHGKQATPGIFGFLFPDSRGKVQDAPPNPFSVFFPSALSIGSASTNTTPTFFFGGSFCVSIPCGIGGITGPPIRKNAPVHNGRAIPRREKNLPRFPNCPAIAPGSLGKLLGFEFPCNLEYKTLLPPFLSVGTFVFPIPCGIEEKKRPPLCENTPVHNGRAGPRREKNLPRFPDCPAIAPGSLGKPLGFEFPCNPEYKTLLPPFLSPAGAGVKKQRR